MMIALRNNFKLLLAFSLLCMLKVHAQEKERQFKRQAPVDNVPAAGFYRILISPRILGYLQPGFSDIRILNAQQQEAPYLWRTESPVSYTTLFKEYSIIENNHKKGCCSQVLVHNPQRRKIDNLSLQIANADAVKQISVSGSYDRENWYAVKEKDVIHAVKGSGQTSELKLLNFPLIDYEFFRILLDDSASAPLNILKAGYYDTYSEAGKYTEIPEPEISRKDSARTTYLTLRFDQPYYPDRLEFELDQPGYFYRTGHIVFESDKTEVTRQDSRRKKWRRRKNQPEDMAYTNAASPAELIPFTLRSDAPAVLEFPDRKVSQIKIQIYNADNQPLSIKSVKAFQLNRYLVASLKPDQRYTLKFGQKEAAAPEYDLHYFTDSIPASAPIVFTGPIEVLVTDADREEPLKKPDFWWNYLLWAALLAVVALLGYMTVKLLNDMKARN